MPQTASNSRDLAGLVTAQLRDCETTVSELGRFPPHISALSARYVSILLREGVVRLPRNADGVRIRLEIANSERLSRESFDVVCAMVRGLDVRAPERGTRAYKVASELFRELTAAPPEPLMDSRAEVSWRETFL